MVRALAVPWRGCAVCPQGAPLPGASQDLLPPDFQLFTVRVLCRVFPLKRKLPLDTHCASEWLASSSVGNVVIIPGMVQ